MKATLLAMTVLLSGPAFAQPVTSYGKIFFQSASAWIPANEVCQKDGIYYGTKKAAIAVDYCQGTSNVSDCTTVLKPLVQPIKSVKSVYVDNATSGNNDNDMKTSLVAFNQSPVVKVITITADRSERVTGTYTIPACGSAPTVPAN